MGNNYIFRVN